MNPRGRRLTCVRMIGLIKWCQYRPTFTARQLAEHADISRVTANRWIAEMLDAPLIHVVSEHRGSRYPAVYAWGVGGSK